MATLQRYQSHGYTYYRLVTSRRGPDGRPRLVVLRHLGTAADVGALLAGTAGRPQEALVVEFGGSAALTALARELGFVSIIDRHAPKRDQGPSTGQYMLLAAINRVLAPRSKSGIRAWYRTTALPRLLGLPAKSLSSQRFWDHMGRLTAERLAAIQEDLVAAVVDRFQIDPQALFYDGTNFDTFLDSCTDSELAQRGHAKSKRTDLRVVSLGLLVSADFHVPLLWDAYPGNRPDAVEFRSLIDRLVERYQVVARSIKDVTILFDKGNNAEDSINELAGESSPYHVVGSLVPRQHRDLLAVDLSAYEELSEPRLAGIRALRTTKEVFGRKWTIVVTRSESLLKGQLRGLAQHVAKRRRLLRRLQGKLQRWYERGRKGKGYTRESLEQQVRAILGRGQHVADVLQVRVRRRGKRLILRYWTDAKAIARLAQQVFGKRILFTDREDWSTAEIILAYRGQHHVERAFRDMKHPVFVSFRPMFHWTDDKIRVHVFYCVSALIFASLLQRQVAHAGLTLSLQRLLADLTDIREIHGLQGALDGSVRRGRPRTSITYTRLNSRQRRLVQILGLDRFRATPYIHATR